MSLQNSGSSKGQARSVCTHHCHMRVVLATTPLQLSPRITTIYISVIQGAQRVLLCYNAFYRCSPKPCADRDYGKFFRPSEKERPARRERGKKKKEKKKYKYGPHSFSVLIIQLDHPAQQFHWLQHQWQTVPFFKAEHLVERIFQTISFVIFLQKITPSSDWL